MEENLLELSQTTVMRGGRPILDRLTLRIPTGRHTAILGPNGSGKTSLLRLITRELYALSGPGGTPTVRVLGQPAWEVSKLRNRLGIVSATIEGGNPPEDGRTGEEVVLSGFFSRRAVFKRDQVTAVMRRASGRWLAALGAEAVAQQTMATMSTGEALRVMIARALVNDPDSLILDEPTAGLDIAARRALLERLRHLASCGKTIVMATHHIEEIIPEIQHVVLMKGGRVFYEGQKMGAMQADRLTALFDVPIRLTECQGYFSADVLAN